MTPYRSTTCDSCQSAIAMNSIGFWLMIILAAILVYPVVLVTLYVFVTFGLLFGLISMPLIVFMILLPVFLLIPLREKRCRRI